MRRWDAPGWLIGRPGTRARSVRNGWWWGRWTQPGECITIDFNYDLDAWVDGYIDGLLDRELDRHVQHDVP